MTEARGRNYNHKVTISGLLLSGILVAVYIVGQFVHGTWDATEERRYTLAPATVRVLDNLKDRVYVKVLLDGRFPASFKRLQESTADMLRQFGRINPDVEFAFDDPNAGTAEEVNARRQELAKAGVIPTQLRVSDAAGASAQYIYPYAIIHFGSRTIPVTLLQDDMPGADKEVIINNSISLLEYKLIDGIRKLQRTTPQVIAFSEGQGELSVMQTAEIRKELAKGYAVNRINLDSVVIIPQEIRTLVIAKPTEPFSEAQLFMLDQYVMHGGNLILMIDPLVVSLDSINANRQYIPMPRDLGLDPLLFKYGIRINPDLVLDLQCTRIPMVVGMQGEKVQTELFPWYYHPLVSSLSDHPVTKNLDKIQFEFPASIDTIQTASQIRKTVLLESSKYSRIQLTPVRLSFTILREEPDPSLFNKGPKALAVMAEGSFTSMFQNRLSAEQEATLQRLNMPFRATGDSAKVLVVSDGDLIKNLVNPATEETAPVGFNKYENVTFTGNRDFLLNAVEYMADPTGVLEARAKDIKLRLLNTVKAREESVRWQVINILGPLALLALTAFLYGMIRRRKYGRPA